MTRSKYIFIGLIGALLVYLNLRACDKKVDVQTASSTLAPGVEEKLIVDPDRHTLIIVKPTGEQKLFLPDRPSSIEIGDNGKVTVTSKQYGTELKLFVGGGYAEKPRAYLGVDLGYWKKIDGGLFLSGGTNGIRLGGDVSYTVFSNTRLALGLDNDKKVNLFVSVRF